MKGISSFIRLLLLEEAASGSLLYILILGGGLSIIYVRNWIWLANEIIFHRFYFYTFLSLPPLNSSLCALLLLFFFDFNDLLIQRADLLLLLSFLSYEECVYDIIFNFFFFFHLRSSYYCFRLLFVPLKWEIQKIFDQKLILFIFGAFPEYFFY